MFAAPAVFSSGRTRTAELARTSRTSGTESTVPARDHRVSLAKSTLTTTPNLDGKVTEITTEVLDKYMDAKKWTLQAHKHITFRSDAFNLESLDGLLIAPIDLSCLESLDVSNNSLTDLGGIEGRSERLKMEHCVQGNLRFQALRVLKARRNSLVDFEAVLPPLRELDLSHNRLTKLPPTGGMPNLEVLVLSHNEMEGSWMALEHLDKLKKLDLSDNKFNPKPTTFGKEVDVLAGLRHLSSLRLKDNLFVKTTPKGGCFPEYQTYLLKRLRNLHELDDLTDKAQITKAMKLADATGEFDLEAYDVMVWNRQKLVGQSFQQKFDSRVEAQVPAWSELTTALSEGLEDAMVIPKTIKHIVRLCDQIVEVDHSHVDEMWRDVHRKAGKRSKDAVGEQDLLTALEPMIQGFLDNFVILLGRVEDTSSSRLMLIRSLAKLCNVHTPNLESHGTDTEHRFSLGTKCIDMLGILMKRSPEAEDEILSVLREIVIEPLATRKKVPVNTVQALCKLDSDKLPRVLSPVVKWLTQMYCENTGGTYPQPDLARLLAIATSNPQNANDALDMGACMIGSGNHVLPRQVMTALENKKLYHAEDCREQHIGHLNILRNTALVSPHAVKAYEERHIHRDLVKNFKDFFGDDADAPESSRQKGLNLLGKPQPNMRICAHIIDALTALMSSRAVLLELLSDQQGGGQFLQYLSIAPKANPVADPLLLAASLKGMHAILTQYPRQNPVARNQVVGHIVKDLEKMKPMLEIIDFNSSKYRELFAAAERHLAERENRKQGMVMQAPRFANLHNPLVHCCFEVVVNLVGFFSANDKADKLCAEVSKAMNGQDRQTLLLKLLEVPSDPVQDAVMKCLSHINTKDLSSEETTYLIKLLDNINDLSSEADVLENVILQMCLLAGSRDAESPPPLSGDHARHAIHSVFKVLLKNAQRNTYGSTSGELQKDKLSYACIQFLQTASGLHSLRTPHMRSKYVKQRLVEVLKCEDDYSSPTTPDVVVESTWTGRDIETLLQSLSGVERLKAKGKVAFRIISRIADVLEGSSDMRSKPGEAQTTRNLKSICDKESCAWDEESLKAGLRFLDDIERDDFTMQQRIFSQYAGFDRIINFLEGLFADDSARIESKMQETAAVGAAQRFLEEAQASAGCAPQPGQEAPMGALELQDGDSDSEPELRENLAEAPSIDYSGRQFTGMDDDEVDLRLSPYAFEGQLGGAMTIFFAARWDALTTSSRILDFGSGSPQDNISIGNLAETNTMVFQFYIGSEDTPQQLTVPRCIEVGVMHKYLLTVNEYGHMKAWRDGSAIGEYIAGRAPRVCQRTNLYVGKSCWSSSVPFSGVVADLKVWQGRAMEWDAVMEGQAEEDDDGAADDDEPPDRQLLMKFFMDVELEEKLPEKQVLLGGLSIQAGLQHELKINEEVFADELEGHMNMVYPVVATLRCCFAMVKVPCYEKIRRDMVSVLCEWLVVSRLVTLVGLCGPLDCYGAAKLLRLMSCALEMPPSETSAKLERVVSCDLMASFYRQLCQTAILAVQREEQDLVRRGRVLCMEIARLASAVCRTVPFCVCSEVKVVQRHFTELCLQRLMPISLVKSIIQILLTDQPLDEGKPATEANQNEIWELGRLVLSQLLEHCPKIKYEILELFSTTMVSSTMALRPSFLAALLAQTRESGEKTDVEHFLNSEDGPARGTKGIEKVLMFAKAQLLVNGVHQMVQNVWHSDACFSCLVTNKGFYVIDITAPGYPEHPVIVQHREFADLTRLVKGEVNQVLHTGWVVVDRSGEDREQFMTLICHSENDRTELMSKLHALSEPPGGQPRHRALLQTDLVFRHAVENRIPDAMLLSAFVLMDTGLQMVVLSDMHFYECSISFERWLPPREESDDGANANPFDEDMGAEGVATTPKRAAAKAKMVRGRDQANQACVKGSQADQVSARRWTARMQFENTIGKNMDKIPHELIHFQNAPRVLTSLEQVVFYPDGQPRMSLFFGDDEDKITMVFFNDTTRENWRKCLMLQLDRLQDTTWLQSYEAQDALTM